MDTLKLSNLQNWALKGKEHIAHRMAVSVMPDHRKYFMQSLYNSYLITIASFSLGFTPCWTSPLVKIYVRFAENQKLVVRDHLQHVPEDCVVWL